MLAPSSGLQSHGQHTPAERITYTRETLLRRRDDITDTPARKTRRALWFFGLLRSPRHAQQGSLSEISDRRLPARTHVATYRPRQDLQFVHPEPGESVSPRNITSGHTVTSGRNPVVLEGVRDTCMRTIAHDCGSLLPPSCSSLPPSSLTDLHHFSNSIPVRVSSRSRNVRSSSHFPKQCSNSENLVKIRFHNSPRKSLSKTLTPSVLYFNARSLKNKVDELSIRCQQLKPDVIVITETWLDQNVPDNFLHISEFEILRCDRDIHGGGVAVYLKSSLNYDLIPLSPTGTDFKSNVIACRLPDFSAILFAIYHPYWGNASEHGKVLKYLQDCFDYVHNIFPDHLLILCGDANGLVDHLQSFLQCNNLSQLINFPTRGDRLLDIFASTAHSSYLQPIKLSPLGRSDHSGFVVKSNTSVVSPRSTKKVRVRDYSKKNHALFLYYLLHVDWNSLLSETSIDDSIHNFNVIINHLTNACFPERTVRFRSDDQPWITPQTKILFDKMDRAFFKNYPQYLILREEYLESLKIAKNKFSKSLFNKSKNSKQLWQSIKKVGKTEKDKRTVISEQLAESLNLQFADSFVPSDSDAPVFTHIPSHSFPVLSEFVVFQQLKKLRSNSCGHDMISGRIFKHYAHELAYPLSLIFNWCLKSCYFPDTWKLANILPIPKGKSEHRPISLLPCASKIFERLFIKHVFLPSLKSDINLFQFGFTPTGCGGCGNAITYIRLSILQHIALTNGYTRGCSPLILRKLSIGPITRPFFCPSRTTFHAILWS